MYYYVKYIESKYWKLLLISIYYYLLISWWELFGNNKFFCDTFILKRMVIACPLPQKKGFYTINRNSFR